MAESVFFRRQESYDRLEPLKDGTKTMTMTRDHLALAGDTTEVDVCYLVDGTYHFMVNPTASVGLSLDGFGRIRVTTHDGLDRIATIGWAGATQYDRLYSLVSEGMQSITCKEAPVGQ